MKHFKLSEFFNSAKAQEQGINNTTDDPAVIANIETLVDKILDPLREAFGQPITISSGYRCPAVNSAVGGSKTSQHMSGQAADIVAFVRDSSGRLIKDDGGNAIIDRTANRRLYQMIIDLGLPFDQLIDESDFAWVHVSCSPRNRRQILKL